jgi:hypothetical protein
MEMFGVGGVFKFDLGDIPEMQGSFKKLVVSDVVKRVFSGLRYNLYLTYNGSIFGAGLNAGGLGDGSLQDADYPTKVVQSGDVNYRSFSNVFVTMLGNGGAIATATDNTLYGWGQINKCNNFALSTVPFRINRNGVTVKSVVYKDHDSYLLADTGIMYTCINRNLVPLNDSETYTTLETFYNALTYLQNPYYAITTSNKLLVVNVQTDFAPLLDQNTMTNSSYGVDTAISGYIRNDLISEWFTVAEIQRVFNWIIDDEPHLVVVCKTGKTFKGRTKWEPYVDIDPTLDTRNVLLLKNGTLLVYQFGSTISRLDMNTSGFNKVLSIAPTAFGVTAAFAICTTNFTGQNCDVPMCFGKPKTDPSVCNGNGDCVSPDRCECRSPYKGTLCDVQNCNPLRKGDNCEFLSELSYTIIGLVSFLLLLALISAIILLFICTCKYRRVVSKQVLAEMEMNERLQESLLRADSLAEKVDRDWIIPFTSLKFIERVSEGAFGVVMKGRYQNSDV